MIRPIKKKEIILIEPDWLAGFSTGECSFTVSQYIRNDKLVIKSIFQLSQLDRDTELLKLISKYLGTGNLYPDKGDMMRLMVQSYNDCLNLIILFFWEIPCSGG